MLLANCPSPFTRFPHLSSSIFIPFGTDFGTFSFRLIFRKRFGLLESLKRCDVRGGIGMCMLQQPEHMYERVSIQIFGKILDTSQCNQTEHALFAYFWLIRDVVCLLWPLVITLNSFVLKDSASCASCLHVLKSIKQAWKSLIQPKHI